MCKVTARAKLNDHELNDLPVLNPGDWFGKTWLLEIGGSYFSLFLVVEADNPNDAVAELADDEKYGHLITVPDEDLDDYDPEDCPYGPSGQVLDLDHLMLHGQEGSKCPFPCRYFGDHLPTDGVDPLDYEEWDDDCCCDTR